METTPKPLVKNGSSTTTTTALTLSVISAYWSFDGNANDMYGVYNGILNGITLPVYGTAANTYFDSGLSISCSSVSQQYIAITNYFNLANQSFTFEAWIYPTSVSGDNVLMSQCTCTYCPSQCLILLIRNGRAYMGFNSNDLLGTTLITTSAWYHIAFVYNYQTLQQIIYIDGVQDNLRSNAQPYQGYNGTLYLARSVLTGTYYSGWLDNVALTTRAKIATEIFNDATQIFYFSFDQPSPYYDNGPNRLNSTNQQNLVSAIGHINQSIRFSASSAYFQMFAFTSIGSPNTKPFTFAVWINPTSVNGGIIIHWSGSSAGNNNQQELLGFTYSGQIVAQLYQSSSVIPVVSGPFVTVNTWNHLAYTFSTTNGVTLYVNGVSQGTSGAVSYYSNAGGAGIYITLGYSFGYSNNYIGNYPFQGTMDEFYAYRRELSSLEIAILANT
ncbi:unnamed protein product [Didymodactylos carnosus]|uniref:Uncharacterized protein n=1 Tax=Didymodactylos carnosus TaxID=1234261 RepID=A0A814VMW2_9BILA|nr:unnamed protein product [Didymodactylos carnosus]CAF3954462.1 unnamed protein product [Didymodactylos carnosus]